MQNQNDIPMVATSWAPQVRVFGETKFVGNALRFATETEAKQQVHNLFMRWTQVEETRVVPSADPVNYRWIHAESRLEVLPVAEQVPA
jgi:hypothetical protein